MEIQKLYIPGNQINHHNFLLVWHFCCEYHKDNDWFQIYNYLFFIKMPFIFHIQHFYWMANVSGLKGKCQRSFLQISKANTDLSSFLESIFKHKQVWKTWKHDCISMILIIAQWKVFQEKCVKIILWQNITICKWWSTSKIWSGKCQNNIQVRPILNHTPFTNTYIPNFIQDKLYLES